MSYPSRAPFTGGLRGLRNLKRAGRGSAWNVRGATNRGVQEDGPPARRTGECEVELRRRPPGLVEMKIPTDRPDGDPEATPTPTLVLASGAKRSRRGARSASNQPVARPSLNPARASRPAPHSRGRGRDPEDRRRHGAGGSPCLSPPPARERSGGGPAQRVVLQKLRDTRATPTQPPPCRGRRKVADDPGHQVPPTGCNPMQNALSPRPC